MKRIFAVFAAMTLMTTVGCGHEQEEARQVTQKPIIGGTPEAAEGTGHVNVNGCSGVLLSNYWVATARHCVGLTPAWTIPLTMGSQSATGVERINHPTLDVSLVKMDQPFLMSGTRYFYHRPWYSGSSASLVSRQLDCHGYGANTADGLNGGTLRQAPMTVTRTHEVGYEFENGGSDDMHSWGDSGGGCFLNGALTGIQSACGCVCKPGVDCWANGVLDRSGCATITHCIQVGADKVRDWADGITRISRCTYGSAHVRAPFDTPNYPTGQKKTHTSPASYSDKWNCYRRWTVDFPNVRGQSFEIKPLYRTFEQGNMSAAECNAMKVSMDAWGYLSNGIFGTWQHVGRVSLSGRHQMFPNPFGGSPFSACFYVVDSDNPKITQNNSVYRTIRVAAEAHGDGQPFGSSQVSVVFKDL